MSLLKEKNFFETENEKNETKPLFGLFTHQSDLNIKSKKLSNAINIENFRKTNFFDIKNSNLFEPNEQDNLFLNNINMNANENKNNFNIIINNQIPNSNNNQQIQEEKRKDLNNTNNTNKNTFSSNVSNKNILGKQKHKNNRGNKKVNKKRNNKRNNISIFYPNESQISSTINNKQAKSTERANSSKNSTKRSKLQLRPRDSPEKFPDDYLSVDESSEEENEGDNNYSLNNINNNRRNKLSYIDKILREKQNSVKDDKMKEKLIKELEGFDLASIDMKKMYRDEKVQNKYFKHINNVNISITYFDKEQIPLHAIFVFNDNDGNKFGYEKKLFPGAYEKEEFIRICQEGFKNKRKFKAELLMDFADMNKSNYQNWMKPNPELFIDFYFLVNICN